MFLESKTPFSQVKKAKFSQYAHYQQLTKPRENCVSSTERAVGSQNARFSR